MRVTKPPTKKRSVTNSASCRTTRFTRIEGAGRAMLPQAMRQTPIIVLLPVSYPAANGEKPGERAPKQGMVGRSRSSYGVESLGGERANER